MVVLDVCCARYQYQSDLLELHDRPVTVVLLQKAKEPHETFGGDRYLIKPFNLEKLLGLIGELIGAA